jgi:DNA primase
VVEGYFDLLALHRAGFTNAVATCGTALTAEHARLLKRYCGRLVLLFDQDSAGRKATFRAMEVLLAEGLPAVVAELEAGEDPDSFLLKRGAEDFRARLTAAKPVVEVFIEATLAVGGESIEGRARAVEEILARLRLLGDIERSLYLKRLAERAGLDEALLRRGIGGPAPAAPPPRRPEPVPARRAEPAVAREGKAQDWLLHLLAVDARVAPRVRAEGVDALFADPDRRAVAERMLDFLGAQRAVEEMLDDAALSEEQRAILSGILLRDEKAFAEETVERAFADCRQATIRHRLRQRSSELSGLIRQAEREGEKERLADLHAELITINRRLKGGN